MWGFEMIRLGIRGALNPQLSAPEPLGDSLEDGELEQYGVDWEALEDDEVLASNLRNNPRTEGTSSWLGRRGPPDHMNEVPVFAPQSVIKEENTRLLLAHVEPFMHAYDSETLTSRWSAGLAFALRCNAEF